MKPPRPLDGFWVDRILVNGHLIQVFHESWDIYRCCAIRDLQHPTADITNWGLATGYYDDQDVESIVRDVAVHTGTHDRLEAALFVAVLARDPIAGVRVLAEQDPRP